MSWNKTAIIATCTVQQYKYLRNVCLKERTSFLTFCKMTHNML